MRSVLDRKRKLAQAGVAAGLAGLAVSLSWAGTASASQLVPTGCSSPVTGPSGTVCSAPVAVPDPAGVNLPIALPGPVASATAPVLGAGPGAPSVPVSVPALPVPVPVPVPVLPVPAPVLPAPMPAPAPAPAPAGGRAAPPTLGPVPPPGSSGSSGVPVASAPIPGAAGAVTDPTPADSGLPPAGDSAPVPGAAVEGTPTGATVGLSSDGVPSAGDLSLTGNPERGVTVGEGAVGSPAVMRAASETSVQSMDSPLGSHPGLVVLVAALALAAVAAGTLRQWRFREVR